MTLKTLQEAILYFSNPQQCIQYVASLRWPDGKVTCPTCGSEAVTWLPTRSLYQCKARHAKRQFSVKVGTVLEDSPIALGKWLMVMWMLGSCRNGISSYEVARTIGVTQKSAWFMLHRLRAAMDQPTDPFSGEVEMDETFYGGKVTNIHEGKRKAHLSQPNTSMGKTVIVGMVERGGRVKAEVVKERSKDVLFEIAYAGTTPDTTLITDELRAYNGVKRHHLVVPHASRYVSGRAHTNTIENFWSCLKRTIKGTYVAVSQRHLDAYVSESAFRFNVRRGFTEQQRGFVLLHGAVGKRLTYKELTAR